ncbi:MAG: hypothetical protein QOJ89_3434 [bacterium]
MTIDEIPSGLPDDGEEAPPLGVPAEDERDDDRVQLPGIPTEDDPPSTG